MRIVVVGHVLEETIILPDGKTVGPVLGGPAAYASIATARLGVEAGLVTKTGRSSTNLTSVLGRAGLDLRGMTVEPVGTKNDLFYFEDGTKKLRFKNFASPIGVNDIPVHYLEAPYWLICPVNYEISITLPKYLHQNNKISLVDLGGYGGAASQCEYMSKQERIHYLEKISGFFRFAKASQEDCKRLFEQDMHPEEALYCLHDLGFETILITLGEKGALVSDGITRRYIEPYPVRALDVTGAGDTWCGAFLSALSRSRTVFCASAYACVVASLFVENSGGVSFERVPTHHEVMERMSHEHREECSRM